MSDQEATIPPEQHEYIRFRARVRKPKGMSGLALFKYIADRVGAFDAAPDEEMELSIDRKRA